MNDDRVAILARLLRALNSSASGTSEPLYAILRAVLQETDADRGFLMVYDATTLRFELGLARNGRRLGPADFTVSTTIVDRALETGGCVVIEDVLSALPASMSPSARELGLEGALCAPLRVDRRRPGEREEDVALDQVRSVAGVLYVDSTTKGKIHARDAGFFEILADGAVLALRARAALRTGAPTAAPAEVLAPPGEPDADVARRYPGIVTRDASMRALLALADRVAGAEANVLVRGESGTGKELLARALHERGLRARGPFEVLDCASLGAELATSTIFGHEKGAFTGAVAASPGAFENASGGTLFLDHLGDMPLAVQASCLRVLQEGEVRRLGSNRTRRVDVRVVAATHRDLKAMVERGEFRHDLLFRLAVVVLELPPLRDRAGDVRLLARHFLERAAAARGARPTSIEPEALVRLEEHPWPGNVRELENVIAAASLEAPGRITRAVVDRLLGVTEEPRHAGTMEDIERRAILERLRRHEWNLAHAAKSLGLDRNTLRRKIVRFGIVREREGL